MASIFIQSHAPREGATPPHLAGGTQSDRPGNRANEWSIEDETKNKCLASPRYHAAMYEWLWYIKALLSPSDQRRLFDFYRQVISTSRCRNPLQRSDDEPPLSNRNIVFSLNVPRSLLAIAVPFPHPLNLESDLLEGHRVVKPAHLLSTCVETCDDPASRFGCAPKEVGDGSVQVGVLPGHPEAIGSNDAVERVLA
jgi:hypothetical protein